MPIRLTTIPRILSESCRRFVGGTHRPLTIVGSIRTAPINKNRHSESWGHGAGSDCSGSEEIASETRRSAKLLPLGAELPRGHTAFEVALGSIFSENGNPTRKRGTQ